MIKLVNNKIIDTKNDNFKRGRSDMFNDIHCHCLPGLDDGPSTMAESLALCRKLAEEGITTVVATPHQLGRFDGRNEAASVREAVDDLNETLRNNSITLKVIPGAEVRVDERIRQLLEADKILTLADSGRYILLELPYQVFIDTEPLLTELASMGIQSIISHAEKIAPLVKQNQVIHKQLENSTYLQITASSLLGDFGPEIQQAAWYLLTSGRATLVATDSHDTNFRRPRMRAAFWCISTKLGEDIARLVCVENPSRVINGQDILPVSIHDRQGANR